MLDAVDAGDDETARKLVEPLHPADVADLIELAARDEREGLVKALAGIVDADVLAEMNDWVREDLLDEMEPQQVADIAGQLETDDAVALIEDLDRDEQQAVLAADGARRPRRGRGGAELSGGIRRPPDAARPVRGARALEGRPGHRLSALDRSDLADRFLGSVRGQPRPSSGRHVQAVDDPATPREHCRSPRSWSRDQTLIPVDMDQEDVALRFQKYALVSAAVVDEAGRLVGMITVDDVVHIIQEEAGEDVLLLSGAGERRHQRAGPADGPLARLFWLVINLGTAIIAAASSACSRARSANMRCLRY